MQIFIGTGDVLFLLLFFLFEWFRRNSLLNTRNFTENVWLINFFFCHPAISQFLMADISFNVACKELKIAQIGQLNQLL